MFEELFSLTFLIASGIVVLINSFILWLAVKIVGGRASFVNAIIFNILITILGFFINLFLPFRFLTQIIILIVWFFLITQFFKVSLMKAFIIAILLAIIPLILAFLGIAALVAGLMALLHLT